MRKRDLKKGALLKHLAAEFHNTARICLLETNVVTEVTPYGPSHYVKIMSNCVFMSTGEFTDDGKYVRVIFPDGQTYFVKHQMLMKV